VIQNVKAGFEEEYDVTVSNTRAVQGQLAQRFASEMEAGAGQADFFNIATRAFFDEAIANGWFEAVDSDDVPELENWPSEYFYEDTFALINVQPMGIAYNTETSAVQPQAWTDLTDPQLKGRILMGDTAINAYLGHYLQLAELYGWDFLEALGAQEPRVVDSMVPGTQSMAAGEADVTVPSLKAVVQPLIDSGAPLEFVIPEDTTGVSQYGGVVAEAAHPNAARLFMSYLLSPDGQEKVTAGIASSVLEDVPDAMPLPAGFVEVLESEALEHKDQIDAALGF
jgi:iron(III) transport system substrate-binding protein